ncbi:MAG: hypothetical protein JXM72_10775 [Deltaproteobacteria bacterium]|nr:hypothetical protein [Deltaproteobacteria bacterium]
MNSVSTIIFLSGIKFGERDFERFGIDLLKQNKFHVEIWDISRVIYSSRVENVALPDEINAGEIRRFTTKKEVLAALDEHSSGTLFICLFELNYRTFPVYRKLSRPGYSYAVLYINPFPIPLHYYSAGEKYAHYFKRITEISPLHFVTTLVNKLLLRYSHTLGIRPATLCLLGGTKSIDFLNTSIDDNTKKVWMHSLDYDIYLQELEKPEEPKEELGVFIEAYFPSDPDRYYHEHTAVFNPDAKYYHDLRKFFSYLETTAYVRIVIAEHPKKHPDLNIADYGNREGICGQTAHLIRKSRLVLSHDSNAVNYAILFKKPIIFLTTRENDKTSNGQNIHAIAERLGKQVLFIDDPLDKDFKGELSVDEKKYAAYIREYLKNSPENIPSWQIFADYVKKNL